MEERSSGKEQRMNFEDFVADTDNTVVLKASEPDHPKGVVISASIARFS
jgi:hypothetical protein